MNKIKKFAKKCHKKKEFSIFFRILDLIRFIWDSYACDQAWKGEGEMEKYSSIREFFLENERQTLSPYACLTSESRGREQYQSGGKHLDKSLLL